MMNIAVKIPNVKASRRAIVDDEDFERVNAYKWCSSTHSYPTSGTPHGYGNKKPRHTLMHRLVMNAKSGQIVDHINEDRYDNRKCNLRFCNKSQNAVNKRKLLSTNTSGHQGVYWHKHKQKWAASIIVEGRKIYVASSKDKEKVCVAYREAHIKYFGEFSPYKV